MMSSHRARCHWRREEGFARPPPLMAILRSPTREAGEALSCGGPRSPPCVRKAAPHFRPSPERASRERQGRVASGLPRRGRKKTSSLHPFFGCGAAVQRDRSRWSPVSSRLHVPWFSSVGRFAIHYVPPSRGFCLTPANHTGFYTPLMLQENDRRPRPNLIGKRNAYLLDLGYYQIDLLPGLKMAFSRMKVPPALLFFLLLFHWMPSFGGSQQDTCQTCRDLVDNFNKGLERTQRENFGGGNTAWEEEKLAKYANSETRLLEVLENVCSTSDFACHQLLEQSEDHVEHWWFHEQQPHPDFFQWLCMDTLKLCCPSGTYGPDCQTCPGGTEKTCSGYGQCDGEGTRGGTGLCMCQTGYGGPFCSECGDGYYEAARNDSHLVCAECYRACGRCSGPEDTSCLRCKRGWMLHNQRCIDIDECGTDMAHCRNNQFCVNTEGSYECRDCAKACIGCMGAGPSRCKKCNKGYQRDGVKCLDVNECAGVMEEPVCTAANEVCENTEGSYRCVCAEGHLRKEGICVEDKPPDAPEKGFFDDITDDEVVVLQQMFFGAIICALATLAAKGDMVFTAIFIGAVAAMAGYWMSERSDRVLDGFMKGR